MCFTTSSDESKSGSTRGAITYMSCFLGLISSDNLQILSIAFPFCWVFTVLDWFPTKRLSGQLVSVIILHYLITALKCLGLIWTTDVKHVLSLVIWIYMWNRYKRLRGKINCKYAYLLSNFFKSTIWTKLFILFNFPFVSIIKVHFPFTYQWWIMKSKCLFWLYTPNSIMTVHKTNYLPKSILPTFPC